MVEEKKKNLSRRDALKVLGAAAGAVALANLPEKWSSPELASGVLPAHAQTSECLAVYVEVLSGVFDFSLQDGPEPDTVSGDGSAGSTLAWICQTGCLFFFLDLNTLAASSGSLQIITSAGTFLENYTDTDNIRDIVIDMATGEISIRNDGLGGTAGSCSYGGEGQEPFNQSPAKSRQRASGWIK